MKGLGITPAVMVNRIVHEAGRPGNHLAQVAFLRAKVSTAQAAEQTRAELLNPGPDHKPAPITSGADIDRLV